MGVLHVVVGFLGTVGMFTLYAIVLPVAAMAIALYLVRVWPLTKRKP